MNIYSAIIQGSEVLRKKYIFTSQLDSEILMAKTLNKDRKYIILNPNKILNKNELRYFLDLIDKRCLGHPVSY